MVHFSIRWAAKGPSVAALKFRKLTLHSSAAFEVIIESGWPHHTECYVIGRTNAAFEGCSPWIETQHKRQEDSSVQFVFKL